MWGLFNFIWSNNHQYLAFYFHIYQIQSPESCILFIMLVLRYINLIPCKLKRNIWKRFSQILICEISNSVMLFSFKSDETIIIIITLWSSKFPSLHPQSWVNCCFLLRKKIWVDKYIIYRVSSKTVPTWVFALLSASTHRKCKGWDVFEKFRKFATW